MYECNIYIQHASEMKSLPSFAVTTAGEVLLSVVCVCHSVVMFVTVSVSGNNTDGHS